MSKASFQLNAAMASLLAIGSTVPDMPRFRSGGARYWTERSSVRKRLHHRRRIKRNKK